MNVLVNGSNLVKGGAIQVAAEFCNQLASQSLDPSVKWTVVLSPQLHEALIDRDIKLASYEILEESPSKSASARKRLQSIESELNPDCVFTIFGPAYVKFKRPHLCGFADGWITHAKWNAYRCLRFPIGWARMICLTFMKGYHLRHADHWVVEADCAKVGLAKRFWLPKKAISVVRNNCAAHYYAAETYARPIAGTPIRILTFASAYKHKNIEIIPFVAKELKQLRPELEFVFRLTIDPKAPLALKIMNSAKQLGVEQQIENLGPIPLSQGPTMYQECSICFMPSLLETFSATYPEAMAMRMPIVTTDLDFARDICGDAAIYYSPRDPSDAAKKLLSLTEQPAQYTDLVEKGKQQLTKFPTPTEKSQQYFSLLQGIA